MTTHRNKFEQGSISGSLIAILLLSLASAIFAVFAVWALVLYNGQKSDVDGKIAQASAEAERQQRKEDEAKFAEREKRPTYDFVGPSDYGSVGFEYPKTWSVYIASNVTDGGEYQAYMNPRSVPPVDDATRFALRVTIRQEEYSKVLTEYQDAVSNGDLRRTSVKFGTQIGTRLNGTLSEDIRGAIVLFKIRDKTAILQTDADTFKDDFDTLVKTVKYVQ